MSDTPAYRAWQEETTRLMPEIMQDAVAYAICQLAELTWAELNGKLGEAEQRADMAEREVAALHIICAKMRDRVSAAEAAHRLAELDADW